MHRTARLISIVGVVVGASLFLAGCGGASAPASSGNGEGEDITIRFAWWGSDARHTATQKAIDAFESANPGITVEAEFGDWGGYWDRLATQTAGGNAPDVMQMSDAYLAEYAGRGVLAPLGGMADIDTSKFDKGGMDAGEVDGEIYALQAGSNFPAIFANPALFDKAGVELPDDTTWTWDDFNDVASQLSAAKAGFVGTDSIIGDPLTNAWLVQNDAALFTKDGKVGFEKKDLESFFSEIKTLSDNGASPQASVITEQMVLSPDQWGIASGKSAMGFAWSNLLTTIESTLGSELKVLRLPTDSDTSGMYMRGAMYYSISAGSKQQEASAKLVNFLLNDKAAADVLLAERGLPLNTEMRTYIADKLTAPEQRLIQFATDQADAFGPAPAVPAVGGGTYDQVIQRGVSDVLFGTSTPKQASEKVHAELTDLLAAAS